MHDCATAAVAAFVADNLSYMLCTVYAAVYRVAAVPQWIATMWMRLGVTPEEPHYLYDPDGNPVTPEVIAVKAHHIYSTHIYNTVHMLKHCQ